MTLANDMTDAQALAIVEEELRKIPATELTKVVLSGFSDMTPISGAIKKSIERICVKGAVEKANNYLPYVLGAVGLVVLYLILK